MSMHHIERFAFDRVFHATAPTRGPFPMPAAHDAAIELAARKAELFALREEQAEMAMVARAEGFEAGLAQARSERGAAMMGAVEAVQAALDLLDHDLAEIEHRLSGEAVQLALATADYLAARALDRAPEAAIEEALDRVLSQRARGTELRIHVHPEAVESIESAIADRQTRDRRKLRITVVPDTDLACGDARICWDQGGLALDAAARRARVEVELGPLLGD